MKPGHTHNPSYPPGSQLHDPEESYCLEDETLCTEDRPCLCCWVEQAESEYS